MALDSHAKEVESWVLSRLLEPLLGSQTDRARCRTICTLQVTRHSVEEGSCTRAIDSFLSEARTKRNRHVLKWLIEVVDDINLCPCVGSDPCCVS